MPRRPRLPGLGSGMGLLVACAAPTALHAQTADSTFHDRAAADIIVTAPLGRDLATMLAGTSVLTGAALTQDLRSTIGDTLARQPGVSATSFGPNASRPVLRGFQGDRVRILTDGIGSFDVSNSSVDHPVVINPLTADRIEVLRGPAALLFGSSAIGGVVNVIDSRIPRHLPDEPVHLSLIATYGTAAQERSVAGAVDVPLGDGFVVHLDASRSKSDDLDTGAPILSRSLRDQAAASDDPAIMALAALHGKLPNSAASTRDLAGGLAYIDGNTNVGLSVNRYDSLFGTPIRYALDPAAEAEQVRLDIRQWREDVRAEIGIGGPLVDQVKFRAGHADYRHGEIEDTGEVGTLFTSDSYEARLELIQAKQGLWQGAIGGQMMQRTLEIEGEEKFLPRNKSQQYGLFTLQAIEVGPLLAEAGLRYEHSVLTAKADAVLGNPRLRRTFDAVSASLGASLPLTDGWRAGLNLSRSERAPTAEELFANGPHAGTQAFEVGNPDFVRERSHGVEATLRGKGTGYTLSLAAYRNWFSNYIYEAQVAQSVCETAAAGRDVDLPCFMRAQADARHYGFEIEGTLALGRIGTFDVVADAMADYVHATVKGNGPAPYIPPLRILGGIEAQSARLDGRLEAEWVDRQSRTALFETPTKGYTMVNASIAWKPFPNEAHSSIIVSAGNLFDVTARRHASALKDHAPLAGRDIRIALRLTL